MCSKADVGHCTTRSKSSVYEGKWEDVTSVLPHYCVLKAAGGRQFENSRETRKGKKRSD